MWKPPMCRLWKLITRMTNTLFHTVLWQSRYHRLSDEASWLNRKGPASMWSREVRSFSKLYSEHRRLKVCVCSAFLSQPLLQVAHWHRRIHTYFLILTERQQLMISIISKAILEREFLNPGNTHFNVRLASDKISPIILSSEGMKTLALLCKLIYQEPRVTDFLELWNIFTGHMNNINEIAATHMSQQTSII